MFASIMRGAKYFTRRDRRNVVFLLWRQNAYIRRKENPKRKANRDWETGSLIVTGKQVVLS